MNITMTRILGMPSWVDFWLTIVLSAINAVIIMFMATKMLQMLQLSNYKIKGVNEWLKQCKFNYWGRLAMVSVLSCASMLIVNVLLDDFLIFRALKYIGAILYLVFALIYIINTYSAPQKTPIKYTHRMNRLVSVVGILAFFITIALMYVSVNFIPYFTAGGMAVVPVLILPIVYLSHFLTKGVEKSISNRYVKKAQDKLAKRTDLIVVGVTGSYGKTSVKNIIACILAEKYRVCVSPFSYNTPLGLTKTILENLEDTDDIFIAEMGARYVGDIATLCKMINPTIGVVTGIGNQHLATFETEENLVKAKSELTDYVTNRNGTMIYNVDSPLAKQMYTSAECEKIEVGLKTKGDVRVKDFECTPQGSKFTLVMENKEYKNVKTKLLGEHNVSNILTAVCVALKLGLTHEQILQGISKVIPTAHRLSLMPSTNALVVIDDAYNGSVEGYKSALNVLSKFKENKVIITPGLVELGKEQFNCNFEFGRAMAKVADYVIITGIVNYDAISTGLEFCNFPANKIIRAGSLDQAVSMLASITNPGDVVLFENDLPDNYV